MAALFPTVQMNLDPDVNENEALADVPEENDYEGEVSLSVQKEKFPAVGVEATQTCCHSL